MKKNISINISGIIFHIEEDGYESLRRYLDSINQYFGSFADSSEILSDIESRIAEIFLSRLNEGKQVITGEDVQSLISIMGSVNDFKAAEDQEVINEGSAQKESRREQTKDKSSSHRTADNRRLVRDKKRKILGGVCAGLGHYFNIDPIWPRLLFALAVLGTSGVLLLLYIVLWIMLPATEELEEETTVKKMYRNPETKVIGGVASGVAAFFGADVVLIRVLFVVFTIFFGTGLVIYIVLWIALPEAKTITEKMQMQGEPVTLSNIETTVKKGLNENQPEESLLARIILFPFRLIAAILNGLGKVLGPLFYLIIEIFRVGIGIVISLVGISLVLALIVAFGAIMGVVSVTTLPTWGHISTMSLPFETIRQSFPTWTAVFAFIALLIPALFVMLVGNSIIAKKIVFHAIFGWTLLVLFFVSAVFLAFSIPRLVYTFKEDADVKVEKVFPATKTVILRMKETGLDDYKVAHLSIHGHEGTDIKLTERFGAQGVTKMNARENAAQVEYDVTPSDSVITFDSNITFKKDATFRFQRLNMDMYIPFEKPFIIEEDMWDLIDNNWKYDFNQATNNPQTFKFAADGKLVCTTCPPPEKDRSGISADDQFGIKDFNELDLSGLFDVVIEQGPEYAIQLNGTPEQKRMYKIEGDGETLEVTYDTKNKNFWKDNSANDHAFAELTITMPTLRKINVTGAGKVKVRGFHEDHVDITMTGALVGDMRFSANQLAIEATGPVVLELDGDGDFLEATFTGPSQLKASSYHVNRASVEAKGLAQVRVNVTGTLEIDKDFTSNVKYTGNPQVVNHN